MHLHASSIQVAALVLGVGLSIQACASKSADVGTASQESSDETEWAASDGPRTTLGVETWALTGTVADGDLFGLSAPDASGRATVKVHAHITEGEDGSFTLDVNAPKIWRFSFVPNSIPTVSGEIPSNVAYALAQGVLDAPAPAAPAAASGGLLAQASPGTSGGTSGSLTGNNGAPICLLKQDVQVLKQGATAAQTKQVVGKAFSTLSQFKDCQINGGDVPDPTNAAERSAYDKCVAAVNAAGCDAQLAYDTVLGGVASGNTSRNPTDLTGTSGNPSPSTGTVGNGSAPPADGVICNYSVLLRCICTPNPKPVSQCMSADECARVKGTPAGPCGVPTS